MLSNKFTSHTQKGFKVTPGCLEHSFAMYEALLDAKQNQRQIIVTWLDLCNAYGSVKHNLVQFALHWYHVPKPLCSLILRYYDKLSARLQTKSWSSPTFHFDIGLFQGCVLSCILFSCVFQLLLDLLKPLSIHRGYQFKDSTIVLHEQAFADDLSIVSSSPKLNQATINVVVTFLLWACLRAKPPKCVCMGMKKFDPRWVHKIDYTRHNTNVYTPFDPELTIAGEKIRFIVNVAADPNSLQSDHPKELGRFISVDINEEKVKQEIRRRMFSDMDLIETCGVNGLCKLFLYQHFVISRLSWVFLVHDLSLSFANELDHKIVARLKRWAGLYRSADVGALFRQREHLGLQLTSVSCHYQHMQVVKSCLLMTSQDPLVQQIYNRKSERVSAFARRWSGPKALTQITPMVEHSLHFAGQGNRTGLGFDRYCANPTLPELRAKTGEALAQLQEEKLVQHAACLVRQGVWTHWVTFGLLIFLGRT